MRHRKYILPFVLTISVSLLLFDGIYRVLREDAPTDFAYQFAINLPVGILIGIADWMLINLSYKKWKGHKWAATVCDLVSTSLVCALVISLGNYGLSGGKGWSWEGNLRSMTYSWLWNWIVVLLMKLFHDHLQQTEMEKQKAQYQFKALKDQINPHFLFNSLNVLASLAYQDAERTNRFAKKLSSVYRYLLTTYERHTVTLEEELAFVDAYLYLERIRFGDALRVEINGSAEKRHRTIIPASIQILTENCLKHNVCTAESPLYIHIAIDSESVTVSNNLQLRNSVAPCGVGLQNLKQQYALHGKTLHVAQTETAFVVTLPFID